MSAQPLVVTVRRRENVVELLNDTTHIGIRMMDYTRALEFATLIRYKARGVYTPEKVYVDRNTAVMREGNEIVILTTNDAEFMRLDLKQALQIGGFIHGKAKEVEELANAQDVANDEALLVRAGALGDLALTRNPAIHDEAMKEAAWGDLRKYLPRPSAFRERVGHISVVREKDSE